MGKGDRRSAKGKRFRHSFGRTRPRANKASRKKRSAGDGAQDS
ncbi:MAG: 30S ribosomal protein THX [Deltaproteobacteria bacterium]|nr:30S ribosomal protein THX [Deltaproteobacteria bacterium]